MPKKIKEIVITAEMFDDPDEATRYTGTYTLQRWDWGANLDATSAASKIDLITGVSVLDPGIFNFEMVARCLIKAPFAHNTTDKINKKMLREMPPWLGRMLMEEAELITRRMPPAEIKNSE